MLTRKQHDALHVIHHWITTTGAPPSFDEIRQGLQLKSKAGVHRLVEALEDRGYIKRHANKKRALEILRMPGSEIVVPTVKPQTANRMAPIMGWIAAGAPVSAIQNQTGVIPLSYDLAGSGEHFALEVRGDSMVEAGILNGDLAIIRRQDDADTGDIVVALIDDEEATLKRLRRREGLIALEAANPAYETRVFSAERVKVQGRLVSITRQY